MPILGTSASQNTKSFLSLEVDILVVAGGGGANNNRAAGAGAGGLVTSTNKGLDLNSQYTIAIGAGGPSAIGYAGSSSIVGSNSTAFSYTANGGGGGDGVNAMSSTGYSGGSGGGGTGGGNSGGPSVGGSATQTSPSGATGYGKLVVQVAYQQLHRLEMVELD